MATQLLSILRVPISDFRTLNSVFSSFFWGEVNGGLGKNGAQSWVKICKLVMERGLGVHSFAKVQRSLRDKIHYVHLFGLYY